ncbi:MAG: carboxypeptidase regulatory-like domain-containing protein [Planctomycetes bacterium]|nr:carboxypeptidase regulatory-like domain-containing protein [Planctomycetota bacterium]
MAHRRRLVIVAVAVMAWLVACGSSVLAGEAGGGKKIVAGKPSYKPKGDHEAWAEKGRIVGLVRQCPGCTIEALDAEGKKVVLSTTLAAKATSYELQWLAPGTYHVRVKADGYATLIVERLAVKAKNDLLMNIEFEE